MKYKITKQFARDAETLLAEFNEYDDAIFFIEKKLLVDQENHLQLIYRLFDNQKMLKAFNIENITSRISPAQYAEGDNFLPKSLGPYKVGTEQDHHHAFAAFIDLKDAELFVEEKLTAAKEIINYYIFKNDVLTTSLNQRIKKQSETSGTSRGQTSSFRPTPLNTTPRPPGSPQQWIKDEKDKDEEEDKNK